MDPVGMADTADTANRAVKVTSLLARRRTSMDCSPMVVMPNTLCFAPKLSHNCLMTWIPFKPLLSCKDSNSLISSRTEDTDEPDSSLLSLPLSLSLSHTHTHSHSLALQLCRCVSIDFPLPHEFALSSVFSKSSETHAKLARLQYRLQRTSSHGLHAR